MAPRPLSKTALEDAAKTIGLLNQQVKDQQYHLGGIMPIIDHEGTEVGYVAADQEREGMHNFIASQAPEDERTKHPFPFDVDTDYQGQRYAIRSGVCVEISPEDWMALFTMDVKLRRQAILDIDTRLDDIEKEQETENEK